MTCVGGLPVFFVVPLEVFHGFFLGPPSPIPQRRISESDGEPKPDVQVDIVKKFRFSISTVYEN